MKQIAGTSRSNFKNEHQKILKWIKNKRLPMSPSQRSMLLFPKLKQRLDTSVRNDQIVQRKQVQIQLTEQPEDLFIEETKKKRIQEYRPFYPSKDKNINATSQRISKICYTEIPEVQKLIQDYKRTGKNSQQKPQPTAIQYPTPHLQSKFSLQSEKPGFSLNLLYMKNMKEAINNNKMIFLNKIVHERNNLQEKNISFEYEVNKLTNGQKIDQNVLKEAYLDVSPNRISKYLKLFNHRSQKEPSQYREKEHNNKQIKGQRSVNQSLHSLHSIQIVNISISSKLNQKPIIKRNNKRAPTIMQQISNNQSYENNSLNIFQSKMRIKNNHKKMIQLNKKSFKSIYMS